MFKSCFMILQASVGLSTKAAKRSIGFMGIGFKAVYKRFSRVEISDGTWHFKFEKPSSSSPSRSSENTSRHSSSGGGRGMVAKHPAGSTGSSSSSSGTGTGSSTHGWVLLPKWVADVQQISESSQSISKHSNWCSFRLALHNDQFYFLPKSFCLRLNLRRCLHLRRLCRCLPMSWQVGACRGRNASRT